MFGLEKKQCGLCGSTKKKLIRTECCNNWICDDEDEYELFSYARNSCSRNHRKYTLCGLHHNNEGHSGTWQTCEECKKSCEPAEYIYCGTNEYNFERLPNSAKMPDLQCVKCSAVIRLGEGEYWKTNQGYYCAKCGLAFRKLTQNTELGSDTEVDPEEKYINQLRMLELSILEVFIKNSDLIDLEVISGLESVIADYKKLKNGHDQRTRHSSILVQAVYDNLRVESEKLRGPGYLQSILSIDELLWCLQYIKKSAKRWNKEYGRQGYLSFVVPYLSLNGDAEQASRD